MTEMTATSTDNTSSAAVAETVARRNFARSAETLALANTPGFDAYLPKAKEQTASSSSQVFPCLGPKSNPEMTRVPYEDSDFSFGDVLDLLNPLQHIPVVGTIYREISGDTSIKPETQVAGDILYGGALGTLSSVLLASALSSSASSVNASIGQSSGTTADKQIADALFGSSASTSNKIQLASAPTADKTVTASPLAQQVAAQKSKAQDAKNAAAAASAASAAQKNFGGLMDTPASQRAAMMAKTNNIQIGKNLYANPINNRRVPTTDAPAKTNTAVTAPSTETKTAVASTEMLTSTTTSTAPTPATASIAEPDVKSAELGQLMHANAQKAQAATQAGAKNPLPPALVQDMMLMALDKYQAANSLGKTEVTQSNSVQ